MSTLKDLDTRLTALEANFAQLTKLFNLNAEKYDERWRKLTEGEDSLYAQVAKQMRDVAKTVLHNATRAGGVLHKPMTDATLQDRIAGRSFPDAMALRVWLVENGGAKWGLIELPHWALERIRL